MSPLRKIYHLGTHSGQTFADRRNTLTLNFACIVGFILMIIYIPYNIYFHLPGAIYFCNFFFQLVFIVTLLCNHLRQYNAAKYIIVIGLLAGFSAVAVLFGRSTGASLLNFILCVFPITVFENRRTMRLFTSLSILAFFSCEIINSYFEPLVMHADLRMLYYMNCVSIFISLPMIVAQFKREVVSYNHVIEEQNFIIQSKNKDLLDSIFYAKRIQYSLLAQKTLLDQYLPDHFVFFKPKDIVSGDFYWACNTPKGFMYITSDCTGHGVPGAFMSLLNISKLNEIINQKNITDPGAVLDALRTEIIGVLNPEGGQHISNDGMDCILCCVDFSKMTLEYAAANNNFYLVRNGKITICKADKMPVGRYHGKLKPFTKNRIELQKGDIIYTLTDGYPDQFGGPKGKKFKHKQLEELLLKNTHLPMNEQRTILKDAINNWKGDQQQIDDILLIGVRVP